MAPRVRWVSTPVQWFPQVLVTTPTGMWRVAREVAADRGQRARGVRSADLPGAVDVVAWCRERVALDVEEAQLPAIVFRDRELAVARGAHGNLHV